MATFGQIALNWRDYVSSVLFFCTRQIHAAGRGRFVVGVVEGVGPVGGVPVNGRGEDRAGKVRSAQIRSKQVQVREIPAAHVLAIQIDDSHGRSEPCRVVALSHGRTWAVRV